MIIQILSRIDLITALCLAVGMAMMVGEMLIPGIGFLGICGTALLLLFDFLITETLAEFVVIFAILFVILALLFIIILLFVSKWKLHGKIRLDDTVADENAAKPIPAKTDLTLLVGREGVTATVLRPAGVMELDGKRYDVSTDGVFIEKDEKVRVVSVLGSVIKVEQVKPIS